MTEVKLAAGAEVAYASWRIGLLEMEKLGARAMSPELESQVRGVEDGLKLRLGGKSRKELAAVHPMGAYAEHFGRWGKAYPVLLQAESIASRGRRLEMPDPLVLALFAAELDGFLLSAAHDLDALRSPLLLDAADGAQAMPTLGGVEKSPPSGDLVLRDGEGIVASVLLGPDSRTRIVPETSRSLFVLYAPPAVGEAELSAGLGRLEAAIRLACPSASSGGRSILRLGPGSER